jgi:3-hydroxyisobutyrate dehydrogenase
MDKPHVGFIGIGVMGDPMVRHLADAGYYVTIFDKNRTKAEKVAEAYKHVKVTDSPKNMAEKSDMVITMLPSGKDVQEVTLGSAGLIEGFRAGSLLLDISSSEPWLTIETSAALKKKGVDMVDAPVSGARAGAESAELIFMAGGDKDTVSRATPVLQIMGKKIFHLGPLGAGHTMKSINNLITAMTLMATTEGLIIGRKYGLDPNVMTDVLNVSTGMSWISKTHIKQRVISRKFDDPFKLSLMIKDINIAMELADRMGLSIPLSSSGRGLWENAGKRVGKDNSISEMVRWVEQNTNTEIISF